MSIRNTGSEFPLTVVVPWLSWALQPGAALGDLASPRLSEPQVSTGAGFYSSGRPLKAVLSREHSLLLGKARLLERCPPPCAAIPAVLGVETGVV